MTRQPGQRHAADPPLPGLPRRAALGLAAASLAAPFVARAAGFPDRPLRLIVPWPPGGSADAQLRSLAEIAQKRLGQPVVVENRAGAGGTLGAQFITTQAKPDGYTLTQMHLSVLRRPLMMRNPPWDPATDFTYVIGLTGWLFGVAVKSDSPIKDWAGYLAAARERPGTLGYTTSGIGTTNHLAMEEIAEREKIQLLHVPYRGGNEGAAAVAGGQVASIADSSAWAPLVDGGRLRLLCVWSAERAPRYPDVPTLRELGYDMVVTSPYGIAGPKNMDPGVVRVLHDACKEALFDPANTATRAQFDMPLNYLDSEQYRDFMLRRIEYEKRMVAKLNLSLD